jgi:hypothetical protein
VEIKAFTPAFLFFIPHKRWMIPKAKPYNVTCWAFKQKLQQIMKSSLKSPLTLVIHVDEFVIGGPEKGKRGKSKGLKKLIVLAIEIVEGRVGRAYAEVIEHSSAVELGGFLIKYVSRETEVVSDKWKGYTPLKKEFKKLKQVASEDQKNFKELHIHIMNIKGWLRGIYLNSYWELLTSQLYFNFY